MFLVKFKSRINLNVKYYSSFVKNKNHQIMWYTNLELTAFNYFLILR